MTQREPLAKALTARINHASHCCCSVRLAIPTNTTPRRSGARRQKMAFSQWPRPMPRPFQIRCRPPRLERFAKLAR